MPTCEQSQWPSYFAAGFLNGYINKLSIIESLKKGTEMSSKVIQQIGARL